MMMIKFNLINVLLVSIIFVVESKEIRVDHSCKCGRANPAGRIVNGIVTSPHKYPWMAAMYIIDKNRGEDFFNCGGSIISTRAILTAGHCIFYAGKGILNTYWMLGQHHQLDGERYDTQAARLHPRFRNLSTHDNYDIGIAIVNREIRFNRLINPICLPEPNQYTDDKTVTVAGWGFMKENGNFSSEFLRETKIRAMSSYECKNQRMFQSVPYTDDSMLCGYAPETDSCQGDSGGPLFLEARPNQNEVVAVVSFGIGCARGPGVYGKITSPGTLDWIYAMISHSNGEMCEKFD